MKETFRVNEIIFIIIEISLQPWDVLVSSLHQRYRLKNINHCFEDNATLSKVCGNIENLVNCERESSCAIVVLQVFAHRKVPGNWRCDFCSSFWNIFLLSHLWTGMPNSWRWSAGPTPLSNEGHQYDRKQSIISIARFVWCQGWYTNRIWLQNQFQTWASTVGQNWGCQPTKWPDMIWLQRSFIDYSNRQLLIRHNMNNKTMIWLFFMRIPPCPLALYRLCLFSEVSHQRHSCSCCRLESRNSIF